MLFHLFKRPAGKDKTMQASVPHYAAPPRDGLTLWYCAPAAQTYAGWEQEALPIGNGDMGAKIFGGIATEQLQFNEKSLWSGSTLGCDGCDNGNSRGDGGASLKLLQSLLVEGNYKEATRQMEHLQGGEDGLGAYQNFGSLYCNIQGLDPQDVKEYIRDLDLTNAVASVSYQCETRSFHREYFASYPDHVICGRYTGDQLNAAFTLKGAHPDQEQLTVSKDTLTLQGALQSKQNPLLYCGAVRIVTDGTLRRSGDSIQVEHATRIDLFCAIKTNYGFSYPDYRSRIEPEAWVTQQLYHAVEKGYDVLRSRHIQDYQSLFGRVSLELGQQTPAVPTDHLLNKYAAGKNKTAIERLLYQYGRYLLIASSRPGGLPANLQGVWNGRNDPAWQSDYHLNINLQMNYFPAMSANLAETAVPLFDFVNHCLVKPGRVTAARYAGIGDGSAAHPTGWMAHTQNNLQGHTGPGSDWRWGWDPSAGAFLLENTYEYYLFTKDLSMLEQEIYPAMEEHALLWSRMLVEDKRYHRLACAPCFSPEHGPVSIGNTYDQELVWQLFANVIAAANALFAAGRGDAVNRELIGTLQTQISMLKPHQVGKWGQLKEWAEEDEWKRRFKHGEQRHHRHISHLLGLYPGNHITPETPDIMEAAKASLIDRGDQGQGWSKALKIGAWARLGDGDHAYRILNGMIKQNILPNLWDTHPPFQIDGNFGYTAGVTEMLLQSHAGYLAVLPALPSCWQEGSFRGLMARGGFEVNCRWTQGRAAETELISHLGGPVTIHINGSVKKIETEKGGHYTI